MKRTFSMMENNQVKIKEQNTNNTNLNKANTNDSDSQITDSNKKSKNENKFIKLSNRVLSNQFILHCLNVNKETELSSAEGVKHVREEQRVAQKKQVN